MELHQLMGVFEPGDEQTHHIETDVATSTFAPLEDLLAPPAVKPSVKGDVSRALEDPRTARMINGLARMTTLGGFIYLASPYSKYPLGIESAFRDVSEAAGELIKGGLSIYSPIAHSHPIAIYGGVDPLDHKLWMDQCRAMMEAARGCIVLQLDGWKESVGVKMEIDYFDSADKPVMMLDPKQLMGGIGWHGVA